MNVPGEPLRKLPHNLIARRSGNCGREILYFKRVYKGKQYSKSLGIYNTPRNIPKAERLRDQFNELLEKGLPLVEEIKTVMACGSVASIDQLLGVYQSAAALRRLETQMKPETVKGYISSFMNIMKTATGKHDIGYLSTGQINGCIVERYKRYKLESLPDEATARQRKRMSVTVRSTLRHARALFAPWVMREYKKAGLALPDMSSFLEESRPAKRRVKDTYRKPDQDLLDRTLTAAAALRRSDPDLYTVWVLAYECGLRAKEMVWAEPNWLQLRIESGQSCYYFEIYESDVEFIKSKAGRSFPVSPEVYAYLKSRMNTSGFMLSGNTRSARESLVKRRFSAWMRGIGWTQDQYSKAAHELRRLFGCRVAQRFGALVAQKRLGHSSYQTTEEFYVDYIDKSAALGPLD